MWQFTKLTSRQLFYGKQSQFVYGLEAEVANVSVGRQVCSRISPGLNIYSPMT